MSFKSLIINHLKNISGWKTKRKVLVFAVDDYGNLRLASKEARDILMNRGIKLKQRFDYFDALDSRIDYEMLFEVLDKVKDTNGNPVIFTTYALPCNVDFDRTLAFGEYIPEKLNNTYARLEVSDKTSYEGAYKMLMLGIEKRLIRPQFHGREHLNVHLFNTLLKEKNPVLMANMEVRSIAGMPDHPDLPGLRFNQAFAFCEKSEINRHKEIIMDGFEKFKEVYGYTSLTFTPPAQQLHKSLLSTIISGGVIAINEERKMKRHIGEGRYVFESNTTGLSKGEEFVTIVRNCIFEPNSWNIDWENFTFEQIKAAFFFHKPAIVSSHRVNFCGHIDPQNRKKSLEVLRRLLKKVVNKWPDIEFIALDDLAMEIYKDLAKK